MTHGFDKIPKESSCISQLEKLSSEIVIELIKFEWPYHCCALYPLKDTDHRYKKDGELNNVIVEYFYTLHQITFLILNFESIIKYINLII